jgi:predicted Zn-dependent protease
MLALGLSACADAGLEPAIDAAAYPGADSQKQENAVAKWLNGLKEKPAGASRARQQQLGDALAAKMLKKTRLSHDKAKAARAGRIVERLAGAIPDGPKWRVHLIDDAKANAFTTGGGHLFITTGMIDLLDDDGRIAAVLAHEMAHNMLGHVVDAQKKKDLARSMHRFSRDVLTKQMRMRWLGRSLSFLVNTSLNTYSRAQEDEADAKGMEYLVAAGWPPAKALETFDILAKTYRDQPEFKNFFYGNHPTYEARRWHLQNVIRAHFRQQAGLPPVRGPNFSAARAGAAAPVTRQDGMAASTAKATPKEPAAKPEPGMGLW